MTPDALAALSARAYRHMIPWTAAQFAQTMDSRHSLLVHHPGAFVLGQVVSDMAEIFALACDPDHQRSGLGSRVLAEFLQQAAKSGADRALLEVSAENATAISFYRRNGFATEGRRKGYYRSPQGGRADALIMTRALP